MTNHERDAVDEEFLNHPVLVYGPRKAGTTLLQNLLDGGSNMLMVPGELKLKVFARHPKRAQDDPARLFMERGRSFFSIFKRDPETNSIKTPDGYEIAGLSHERLVEIFNPLDYFQRLSDLLAQSLRDLGQVLRSDVTAFVAARRDGRGTAARWASKEVGGDPAAILELFRRHFPEGRVVFLMRQPEFVVRSILLDRRRKGVRMSVRRILCECVAAQNIVNYGNEHALREDVVVAYEQLTDDVPGEMRRVCRLLDIPFENILTSPTTFGIPVVVATSSRQTKKVFRQAGRWQEDLTWRQVGIIRLFQVLAPLFYFLRGRKFIPYDQVVAAVNSQKLWDVACVASTCHEKSLIRE